MVGGAYIVFTRKAVVEETFVCKSSNLCKSIVGINARQLYSHSMCQPMPTGLYTRCECDPETKRFTARQNRSRSFENMVLSTFQRRRPDCKNESNVTTGRQKKIDCFSYMEVVIIVTLFLKLWGVTITIFPAKKQVPH